MTVILYRVYMMMGRFINLSYMKIHFMLIKYMCDSKLQSFRMHYPFQSTCRLISHQHGWLFCMYTHSSSLNEILAPVQHNWVECRLEWLDRAGMTFCGYHANKYRAMRGNRSELARAGTKVVPVSCKLPLKQFNVKRVHLRYSITLDDKIAEFL